jgi:outer membrane receptor protein involved in Fe transport
MASKQGPQLKLTWLFALLLSLGVAGAAEAQQLGRISGSVVDATSGAPLGEVQVYLPGSNLGGLTRQDGRVLILNVPVGAHEVRAERIGMTPSSQQVTVTADGTVTIEFRLETQALGLDEIVVTGTAGAARRREVGNAISQINLAQLPERPIDAAAMLQAAAPGVELTLSGGETGNGSRIRLRGANSVEMSGDPIIYIDGIRMMNSVFPNNTSPEYRASRGSNNQPSALQQINPNDIERIEIIKGSAATTLYGTEASSGVIQVFTKRGAAGRPVWTVETQQGTEWTRKFGGDAGVVSEYGSQSDYLWMDPWICTGPFQCGDRTHQAYSQQYSLSVRGGAQNLQYFVSGQRRDDVGQLPQDELEEWAIRGNFTVSPIEDVTLQWNTSFTQTSQQNTPVGGNSQGLTINVFRQKANYLSTGDPEAQDVIKDWDITSVIRRLTTGGTLTYSPTPSLSNRLTIGYDYSAQDSRNVRPFGYYFFPDGAIDIDENARYLLTFDYVGNYSFDVTSDLSSNFSWGGQAVGDQEIHLEGFGTKFPGAAEPTISSGSQSLAFEDRSKVWNAGFFFQNVFDLSNRYFITLGLRVDGNSAFGSGFGLQTYPKASASWVVSDEAWFPDSFGDLKVRSAYGKSGRAPGTFDAVRTWQNVGLQGQAAFVPRNVGNSDLGPEVTSEIEGGFDAAWFDGRVQAGFTYYRQLTQDALLDVDPIPSAGFANAQLTNVGEVRNSGTELTLSYAAIRGQSFGWDLGLNVSTNESEVLSHVQPNRVGKPISFHEERRVLNPEEIAAPRIEPIASYFGPALPTRIVSGNTSVRLPGNVIVSARGEYKGGYWGEIEPIDISRSPRSPACWAYYANDVDVALKADIPALWRARCTPGINRGWNFKQDNFRLTAISATVPLSLLPSAPDVVRNASLMLTLGNSYTWFREIPIYDSRELESYRLPSPVTLRASLRTTF